MRHTFWSCPIICINMKWIYPELSALQSGHGMRDGRTDGQTDGQTDGRSETNIPPNNFVVRGYNYFTVVSDLCIMFAWMETCFLRSRPECIPCCQTNKHLGHQHQAGKNSTADHTHWRYSQPLGVNMTGVCLMCDNDECWHYNSLEITWTQKDTNITLVILWSSFLDFTFCFTGLNACAHNNTS